MLRAICRSPHFPDTDLRPASVHRALHRALDWQQDMYHCCGCLRDMSSLPCWALRVLPVQAAEEAESAADLLQKAEAALEEVARAEAAAAETGEHSC